MGSIKYTVTSLELLAYPFHMNWFYPIQEREFLLFLSRVPITDEQQSLAVREALYVSLSPASYVTILVTFPNNGLDRRWAQSRGT